MRFAENEIYHIYNRGNNYQTIFFSEEDYLNFLSRVKSDWVPVCDILAWCLMPNHFHFIIHANGSSIFEIPSYGGKPMQILARKIGLTLSSYSQHINRQNKTSGSLFQQKTKAKCISAPDRSGQSVKGSLVSASPYIINCMHYIHQNS